MLLERTHKRIVEGFPNYADEQRLISVFLINDLIESDKWSEESIELIEIYLEPVMALLEPVVGRIATGYTRILTQDILR